MLYSYRKTAFLMILLAVVASSVLGQPKISIPEREFDFGRVAQHAAVSHRFWLKSVGDQMLEITKVESGCGCTKAPLKDSVLAPGDSTYIELTFSTKSYRGSVTKRPYLQTNAGPEKEYLKILSELLPEPDSVMPLHISPSRLDVSQFKAKPRRRAKFWVHNKSDKDIRLTLVDHADHVFDVKLPELVKAHDSAWGGVVVHEDHIATEFEHSLTFELDDDSHTRYTLPVMREYRIEQSSLE